MKTQIVDGLIPYKQPCIGILCQYDTSHDLLETTEYYTEHRPVQGIMIQFKKPQREQNWSLPFGPSDCLDSLICPVCEAPLLDSDGRLRLERPWEEPTEPKFEVETYSEDQLEREWLVRSLNGAFDITPEDPPEHIKALVLKKEGKTYREIGAVFGKSRQWVGNLIERYSG